MRASRGCLALTRRKHLVGERLVFEIHPRLDGEAAGVDPVHENVGPVVAPALDGPGAALQGDGELVITNDVQELRLEGLISGPSVARARAVKLTLWVHILRSSRNWCFVAIRRPL